MSRRDTFQKPPGIAYRKLLYPRDRKSLHPMFRKQMFLGARSNEVFIYFVTQSKV
jgi:hypothetical protein